MVSPRISPIPLTVSNGPNAGRNVTRALTVFSNPHLRDPYSLYLGCVQLVLREKGEFIGVADPRRDDSASGPLELGADGQVAAAHLRPSCRFGRAPRGRASEPADTAGDTVHSCAARRPLKSPFVKGLLMRGRKLALQSGHIPVIRVALAQGLGIAQRIRQIARIAVDGGKGEQDVPV